MTARVSLVAATLLALTLAACGQEQTTPDPMSKMEGGKMEATESMPADKMGATGAMGSDQMAPAEAMPADKMSTTGAMGDMPAKK